MKSLAASTLIAAILWWPSRAWQGYLGAIVWRWFAVGLFHAAPITTWQAVAVIVLLNYFLPSQILPKREPQGVIEDAGHTVGVIFAYGFLLPALTFVSAWIVWRFFL